MKAQVRQLKYEEVDPPLWWRQSIKLNWQRAIMPFDRLWWFVMKAEMVRQIGPDQPPEVVDPVERIRRERIFGPGI